MEYGSELEGLERRLTKTHEEICGGDGHVHYVDFSDDLMVLCFKFVQFILC